MFQNKVKPSMRLHAVLAAEARGTRTTSTRAAIRLPRVTKQTVPATNAGHDLYLFTNQPKRRNAMKLAGTPATRLSTGVVSFSGVRKNTSPTKVPSAAPTATGRVSETTAKNAGMKSPTRNCADPPRAGDVRGQRLADRVEGRHHRDGRHSRGSDALKPGPSCASAREYQDNL